MLTNEYHDFDLFGHFFFSKHINLCITSKKMNDEIIIIHNTYILLIYIYYNT